MKRIIMVLLAAALLFSMSACFQNSPQTEQTTKAPVSTTVPTTQAASEPVYNYTALEDILDKYTYDYIGGWMDFAACGDRLYFADHEYGTAAVNYYDFSSGNVKNLAVDNNNPLSAPCTVCEKSVVVAALPAGTDPLEAERTDYIYHIYDLEKGTLFTLEKHFDFRVIAYLDGKLYGNDEQGNICICNRDGSDMQRIAIGNFAFLNRVWLIDGELLAELGVMDEGDQTTYRLVKMTGGELERLIDSPGELYFDGSDFYYFLYADRDLSSTPVKRYDVKTGTEESLFTPKVNISHIYFSAGERVYYQTKTDDYHIALCYYDMKTQAQEQFSTGMPAMGGW